MKEEMKNITDKEVVNATFGKMITEFNLGRDDEYLMDIMNTELKDFPKKMEEFIKELPKFMRRLTVKQFFEMSLDLDEDDEV